MECSFSFFKSKNQQICPPLAPFRTVVAKDLTQIFCLLMNKFWIIYLLKCHWESVEVNLLQFKFIRIHFAHSIATLFLSVSPLFEPNRRNFLKFCFLFCILRIFAKSFGFIFIFYSCAALLLENVNWRNLQQFAFKSRRRKLNKWMNWRMHKRINWQKRIACNFMKWKIPKMPQRGSAFPFVHVCRSEYDRGVNTFSPEGRLFQVNGISGLFEFKEVINAF